MLPDELVVTDDGSTDETVAMLEQFAKVAPFAVRIVRNTKNLGFTQNFAKAISLCSGDIILLSDQDDVWLAEKVERIASAMAGNPDCWVLVHDGRIVDETLSWNGVTKMGQVRSGFGNDTIPETGALTAIRRAFVPVALPIPDDVVGHDIWLHALCRAFDGRRIAIDDCLQLIRRHRSNTSEWVANSHHPIGPVDVLRSHIRTRPATDYGDRIALNTGLRDRLTELLETHLELPRAEGTEAFLASLDQERKALAARQALVQSDFVSRRARALAMLFLGQYTHFNGFHSFLRDVAR
jgi:glycosyltransferase involved in cell wall biosynthesis